MLKLTLITHKKPYIRSTKCKSMHESSITRVRRMSCYESMLCLLHLDTQSV